MYICVYIYIYMYDHLCGLGKAFHFIFPPIDKIPCSICFPLFYRTLFWRLVPVSLRERAGSWVSVPSRSWGTWNHLGGPFLPPCGCQFLLIVYASGHHFSGRPLSSLCVVGCVPPQVPLVRQGAILHQHFNLAVDCMLRFMLLTSPASTFFLVVVSSECVFVSVCLCLCTICEKGSYNSFYAMVFHNLHRLLEYGWACGSTRFHTMQLCYDFYLYVSVFLFSFSSYCDQHCLDLCRQVFGRLRCSTPSRAFVCCC